MNSPFVLKRGKGAGRCIAWLAGLFLAGHAASDDPPPPGGVPRAVTVARATAIPDCTLFVDAATGDDGAGSVVKPFNTIEAAVTAAESGAVICVAEGTYSESITPGAKAFTLAGGFQRGSSFKLRDSAAYPSRAVGKGGSFIRIAGPAPTGDALTAIDGFEITGYAQAIYRDFYISQRFNITNNIIHNNNCNDPSLAGAGFALVNVSGTIAGNVFLRNVCGRGGAGAINDTLNENSVRIERNLIQENAGNEPDSSHGGAIYLFVNKVLVNGNAFIGNRVTGWGGGLYVGAFRPGNQTADAVVEWNFYRANRAGNTGGGFFCDDGATCTSRHEIYVGNCGGNIYLDGGSDGSGPTAARFDHLTSVGGLEIDCTTPGAGVRIDKDSFDRDTYSFTNAIFWQNAPGGDFITACMRGCDTIDVTVSHSMVERTYGDPVVAITFGDGIVEPVDPLFADPARDDFHLKSSAGRWATGGHVSDPASSPLLASGDPASRADANPERAGERVELGSFGNSPEASYVR